MIELLDMGKYNFFVWTSVAVFVLAIIADAINIHGQRTHLKRTIKSKAKKAKNRTKHSNPNQSNPS